MDACVQHENEPHIGKAPDYLGQGGRAFDLKILVKQRHVEEKIPGFYSQTCYGFSFEISNKYFTCAPLRVSKRRKYITNSKTQ